MTNWVLSVVGITALSVLLDVILPEGKINKYIKGVFAIMTVTVIFAPVPDIIANIKNIDVGHYDDVENISVDETLYDNLNEMKIDALESKIANILLSNGIVVKKIDTKIVDGEIQNIHITIDDNNKIGIAKRIVKRYIRVENVEVNSDGTK